MNINENTLGGLQTQSGAAIAIESTDEFQIGSFVLDFSTKSIIEDLFPEIGINGPTAAFFNAKKTSNNTFELLRSEIECFDSIPMKTGITKEAIEDLIHQFGEENARSLITSILQSQVNEKANERTLQFLENESQSTSQLVLDQSIKEDAERTIFQILKKISEITHEGSIARGVSRKQYCMLPYEFSAAFELLGLMCKNDVNVISNGNVIQESQNYIFVRNPDKNQTQAFVGIRDIASPQRSQAIYTPFIREVKSSTSYESGETQYHLFDRYAITQNPLHDKQNAPLMWKFNIS